MIDSNDCSVYAVAACCGVPVGHARYWLWKAGRSEHDGATDRQISTAIRLQGYRLRRLQTPCKTLRGFARLGRRGTYLVTCTDHVVAVVDGYVFDRPEVSDLIRIEKVHEILFDKPVSVG